MAQTQINTEKLKQIRERLPFTSGKEIQKRTGLCETTVSRNLNGKTRHLNMKVIVAAYEIIEEQYAKLSDLEKQHNKILNNN